VGCPFSLLSTAEVDPFPAYEQARQKQGSVMWDPSMKAWLVLDYSHCAHIEMHEDSCGRVLANIDYRFGRWYV
jgi:hypothetical protein